MEDAGIVRTVRPENDDRRKQNELGMNNSIEVFRTTFLESTSILYFKIKAVKWPKNKSVNFPVAPKKTPRRTKDRKLEPDESRLERFQKKRVQGGFENGDRRHKILGVIAVDVGLVIPHIAVFQPEPEFKST